ncbi:MAG: PIN domain nuclease, partial [Candidatus Riflebacteria bacterium]|nr:PIN domain nuclease [Candidatus Riflebacteria bacterium]
LAEFYVLQGPIPRKYVDDATHVAIAVVNRLDAIVSWNCEHLVKLKTKREVNALNKLNGYAEIDIVTPEEVE